jgi:hypothetical protein
MASELSLVTQAKKLSAQGVRVHALQILAAQDGVEMRLAELGTEIRRRSGVSQLQGKLKQLLERFPSEFAFSGQQGLTTVQLINNQREPRRSSSSLDLIDPMRTRTEDNRSPSVRQTGDHVGSTVTHESSSKASQVLSVGRDPLSNGEVVTANSP